MCVLSVGLSAHCRTGARWLPSHTVSEGVCGTMRAEANYLNEARAGKASRRELCLPSGRGRGSGKGSGTTQTRPPAPSVFFLHFLLSLPQIML